MKRFQDIALAKHNTHPQIKPLISVSQKKIKYHSSDLEIRFTQAQLVQWGKAQFRPDVIQFVVI